MNEYSCRKLDGNAYGLRITFDVVRWVDGKPCIGSDQIWYFSEPTCADILNALRTMEARAMVMQ